MRISLDNRLRTRVREMIYIFQTIYVLESLSRYDTRIVEKKKIQLMEWSISSSGLNEIQQ